MSRKAVETMSIRYGDRCIRVTFTSKPNLTFLVYGLDDMADVEIDGTYTGFKDALHFEKAQARSAARVWAFEQLRPHMKVVEVDDSEKPS